MSPCQHGTRRRTMMMTNSTNNATTTTYPPSLTLLSCSNSSELADFCALVVPCIWAGSSFKQQAIVNAKRYATFKMFCQKILKATQISCACVLLALYYIHRLRSAYPSIRASIGSEVRLFTTALILANKFLDDNTFTNKTWSDVSSIPVRELNIMEMEFLSALNYNIYIHHQQFFAWVAQCQHWVPLVTEHQQHHHRPIKMPARLSIKSSSSSSSSSSLSPSILAVPPLLPPPLAMSASMPTILPSTTTTTTTTTTTSTVGSLPTPTTLTSSVSSSSIPPPPLCASLKRSNQEQQQQVIEPPTKRRYYHVPYTPPDETISYPQTPLYTPPDLRLSLCTSNINNNNNNNTTPRISTNNNNNTPTTNSSLCRPILSWSSSSSALASSRHQVNPYSSSAAAVSSVANTAATSLTSRVRCLEIE